MSWSFFAIGKPPAVLKQAHKQLDELNLKEPEAAIKNSFLVMLDASLSAMPENSAVKIQASGSQSIPYTSDGKLVAGRFNNQLNVQIDPMYGFVE